MKNQAIFFNISLTDSEINIKILQQTFNYVTLFIIIIFYMAPSFLITETKVLNIILKSKTIDLLSI